MINASLPFSANVDGQENSVSCRSPRVEEDDETNHDNERNVLGSVKDHDLRRREVQCLPTAKMRVWDMVSS